MAKLVAKSGKIMSESTFVAGVLNVQFRHAAIAPSGDLGECEISDGTGAIHITYAQAISLANEIMRRCQR